MKVRLQKRIAANVDLKATNIHKTFAKTYGDASVSFILSLRFRKRSLIITFHFLFIVLILISNQPKQKTTGFPQ